MTIGENIKKYRTERGLTQKQLGEACNPPMAESTIRQYELGFRNPKPDTLQKIATALGVSCYNLDENLRRYITDYSIDLVALSPTYEAFKETVDTTLKSNNHLVNITVMSKDNRHSIDLLQDKLMRGKELTVEEQKQYNQHMQPFSNRISAYIKMLGKKMESLNKEGQQEVDKIFNNAFEQINRITEDPQYFNKTDI